MAELDDSRNNTNAWKSWYVMDSDSYATCSQDLIAASRALHNQRKQLHKVMNHCEDIFERFKGNYDQTERAKLSVENELMKLTRCMTYWCYMLLAKKNVINWDMQSVSRFGIKPSMKYTEKRHLLNIDTIIQGHTYNWKADFQGSESFPNRIENTDDVKELLSGIKERISSYHEKIESKINHKINKQQKQPKFQQQSPMNFNEINLRDTLNVLKSVIEDLVEKLESNPDSLTKHEKNSLHALLGKRFHGDKDDPNIHDQDGDVTYNTKKQIYYKFESEFALEDDKGQLNMEYSVEVMKHFPYRRNRGVHMDIENKRTIKWLNKVLPHVSKGWYEIVILLNDRKEYKIQLTPWERKNTTFVRPFALVSKQSPVHKNENLIDLNNGFDFREGDLHDFEIRRYPPYLIHGKGNEIDAMVQSLRVIDNLEKNVQEKIDDDIESLFEQIENDPSAYGPLIQDQHLMKYMRAYYSSDAKSGVVGDRSVFFFNIQGVVVGVEMYAPSLPPYVDLQGRSGGYGKLPKRPQQPHNAWDVPAFYPPAPQHQVHVQTIPPEIQQFIKNANKKMEDVEKYMQNHKAELPAQIERIVKEATKELHAARGAIESNSQQQQQNVWTKKPSYNPFTNDNSTPQNVHAKNENKNPDPSAMTHDQRLKHEEKEKARKAKEEEAARAQEKAEKEKFRRSDPKHREIQKLSKHEIELLDGEKIKSTDFPSSVEGHYNEMYQLQLYPPYKYGVPNVDISGLVPESIRITIGINTGKIYSGILRCLDSTIPVFGGKVRISPILEGNSKIDRECYLIITRRFLKNRYGIFEKIVWGMKCKVIENYDHFISDCQWIAHKSPNADQFLIGGLQNYNWSFTHNLDMQLLEREETAEVTIENSGDERCVRGANEIIQDVPERKKSEIDDEYQQMNVEDLKAKHLYGLSPENLIKYTHRQEVLKQNHRVNKIILYTFSQDYMKKLIEQTPELKSSVNIFSCPKFLKMNSYWLNTNPDLDPQKIDPKDSNMFLVDTQGPVYVSENGRFMVSPYLASNGEVEVATWGIFIWNSNLAKYETFAYKLSGRQSQFLINDPENTTLGKDIQLGSRAENIWIQFKRFDGTAIGDQEIQRPQQIQFYLADYDTEKPTNPYHMFPRFPDYTISLAEHNILKYQAERRGQQYENGTETQFEEHTPFHEANILALEAFTEQHLNVLNTKTKPVVHIPNITYRRQTPAASAPPPTKPYIRKFIAPTNNLQTYRTYRLEPSVLDYNPWEFAMNRVLSFVNRYLHTQKEKLGDDTEFKDFLTSEEEKIKNNSNPRTHAPTYRENPNEYKKANLRPYQGQRSRTRAEYTNDADDYLLRQCFDDPPASQRLPAQPRKLAAPVRTFAPWKPPAAGVSW